METRVQKLIQGRPGGLKMAYYVVPEQERLLENDFVPEFPYDRTLEQARSEPLVILHTSRCDFVFGWLHVHPIRSLLCAVRLEYLRRSL